MSSSGYNRWRTKKAVAQHMLKPNQRFVRGASLPLIGICGIGIFVWRVRSTEFVDIDREQMDRYIPLTWYAAINLCYQSSEQYKPSEQYIYMFKILWHKYYMTMLDIEPKK
ncbi:unnamed protein product [Moneuplotes crassus]|uniref:Uncharacterized protein n=1 Tax=Euplotes crassus TaxID=5936 RepID=A0AAD2DA13_EUPCR|nr:unnamed protein product [Moneuplotes crassus]